MSSEKFSAYKHSGKFGMHAPALMAIITAAASFALGLAYAYLVKWIPFIYLNFLLTAGYGFVIGFVAGFMLKVGKVRNTPVLFMCGLLGGAMALYGSWSGHLHALIPGAPIFASPDQLISFIKILYAEGSWGMSSGSNVTGVMLAIVWVIEAGIMVGLVTLVPVGMLSDTPFCEKNQCWLDEEKKINTLAAFTEPEQIAALSSGDLGPLTQAKPCAADAAVFARVTLKHSPKCDEFCTVGIANVTVTIDKEGNANEDTQELAGNLVLPKSMLELITKFESFGPTGAEAAPAEDAPPA